MNDMSRPAVQQREFTTIARARNYGAITGGEGGDQCSPHLEDCATNELLRSAGPSATREHEHDRVKMMIFYLIAARASRCESISQHNYKTFIWCLFSTFNMRSVRPTCWARERRVTPRHLSGHPARAQLTCGKFEFRVRSQGKRPSRRTAASAARLSRRTAAARPSISPQHTPADFHLFYLFTRSGEVRKHN